jgi:hypothetical protein
MQKGGVFKAQGADTCVFIPQVDCAKKGKRTLRRAVPGTEFVSRITQDDYEIKVQRAVAKALDALDGKGVSISKFFNLADSSCVPQFKPLDDRTRCTITALQGDEANLHNLVTPKQNETLLVSIREKTKPDILIKNSVRDLMLAMVRINEEHITHSDSHFNNIGWMGNQLVIFDWGRGTTDKKSFKGWASRYVVLWNMAERAHWKSYNQHKLQFALIDEMEKAGLLKKAGTYGILMSVWDTLGLLGPARTHGIVSEERAKVFTDTLFKWVVANVNTGDASTEVTRLIPALFADPPEIHPATADKPMPPAEAEALGRIIPSPEVISSPTLVPQKPADPVPTEDKKMTDIKNACRALLATGGTRRRRRRGTLRR